MTPVVEEFYNHVHGKGGRFASSSNRSGSGKFGTTGVRAGTGSPARYTSKGPAVRKGFDKIIAAHRAGKTSATHSKAKVESPGSVYTKLAGSHTIRKTKDGKFVLHSKDAAPQRASKVGADHIKALDARKPTMADVIAGRVHRILAKG